VPSSDLTVKIFCRRCSVTGICVTRLPDFLRFLEDACFISLREGIRCKMGFNNRGFSVKTIDVYNAHYRGGHCRLIARHLRDVLCTRGECACVLRSVHNGAGEGMFIQPRHMLACCSHTSARVVKCFLPLHRTKAWCGGVQRDGIDREADYYFTSEEGRRTKTNRFPSLVFNGQRFSSNDCHYYYAAKRARPSSSPSR